MVRNGKIMMYYGDGRGKTALAIGQGIRALGEGFSVVMIQFLDYYESKEFVPLKSLEPNFRVFKFQKGKECPENAAEMKSEVSLAMNFSKKILETGECEVVILDGILDAVAKEALSAEEVAAAMEKRSYYTDIILTGTQDCPALRQYCDYVCHLQTEQETKGEA